MNNDISDTVLIVCLWVEEYHSMGGVLRGRSCLRNRFASIVVELVSPAKASRIYSVRHYSKCLTWRSYAQEKSLSN